MFEFVGDALNAIWSGFSGAVTTVIDALERTFATIKEYAIVILIVIAIVLVVCALVIAGPITVWAWVPLLGGLTLGPWAFVGLGLAAVTIAACIDPELFKEHWSKVMNAIGAAAEDVVEAVAGVVSTLVTTVADALGIKTLLIWAGALYVGTRLLGGGYDSRQQPA